MANTSKQQDKLRTKKDRWKQIRKDKELYILLLPAFLVTLVFRYFPMPGIIMAFQKFSIYDGLLGSKFVGFDNIVKIFTQNQFTSAIWNTLYVSILSLIIGFPSPIILALLINELRNKRFKKVVQTISYLPHFLSWISVVGIIQVLFGRDGFINDIRMAVGASERYMFLAQQNLFIWFILGTSMWKETGWGTVIHLAKLSSINPELYEAAEVDGAKHLQKTWYITLPHMMPTIVILLIFRLGSLFASNFQLIYGLQNPYIDFEVISTIVFQTGIKRGGYSMSTAVGFVEGIVALLLVLASNKISKKLSGIAIW